VGVGRISRGPIGVEGLTITAGSASRAIIDSTTFSAATLLRLYAPTAADSSSKTLSSAASPPRRNANVATLLVYTMRLTPARNAAVITVRVPVTLVCISARGLRDHRR